MAAPCRRCWLWEILGMKAAIVERIVGLAVIAALGAGCDGESDAPPPPPEVTASAIAQELESVVCDLAFDCECTFGRQFETRGECSDWATVQQAEADRLMQQYDLTWEPTCLGWYVQAFQELECASQELFTNDPDGDGCSASCSPLHGTKQIGQACQQIENRFSDCDNGLRCDQGVCVELCPEPLGAGEICNGGTCGEGLYCDFSGEIDALCRPKARDGDDCTQAECAEGLRCIAPDPMDLTVLSCAPLATMAEPCMGHDQCDTGYCPAGFCDLLPVEGGDCRGTLACAEGFFCIDDVCAVAKERGDACTTACGGGLDCVDGVCLGANAAVCWPDSPIASN